MHFSLSVIDCGRLLCDNNNNFRTLQQHTCPLDDAINGFSLVFWQFCVNGEKTFSSSEDVEAISKLSFDVFAGGRGCLPPLVAFNSLLLLPVAVTLS
jgi:hypothetical protein